MMKTRVLLILLFCSTIAAAQFTAVSGTVTDPNGLPYANATISATLNSTASPFFVATGAPYSPPMQPVGLNSAGSFSMNLADVTQLTPGASTYNFTVCSGLGTVQPAGGKGPVCFTVTNITISGSSQSITTTLTAAAPALTFNPGTGTIGGSGTLNTLSKFTPGATTLGNSLATDNGTTENYAGTGGSTAAKFGATGTGAGQLFCTQGAAIGAPTNGFAFMCPTSIPTGYFWTVPGAQAAGDSFLGVNSSGVATYNVVTATWSCHLSNALTSNVNSCQFTTPAFGITVKGFDVYAVTAANTCTTFPTVQVQDVTASAIVGSFSVPFTNGTNSYAQVTGSTAVTASHVLAIRTQIAANTCTTTPAGVDVTVTYTLSF